MTKAERKLIIHAAAEMIATNKETYSCNAIEWACDGVGLPNGLRWDYSRFYAREPFGYWLNNSPFTLTENKKHRLMLLAWFAEVGPEGLTAPASPGWKRDE